jgi:hypothetical protein
MMVTLYETNSDLIYAGKGDELPWGFGPVTPDMHGRFASDAAAWAEGDWEPGESNGQHQAAGWDGLVPVARWDSGSGTIRLLVERGRMGGAAELYIEGRRA